MIGRRHVIKREKDAGNRLRNKQKEQNRPEHVCPSCSPRDRFIQSLLQQRSDPGATIDPLIQLQPSAGSWLPGVFCAVLRLSHFALFLTREVLFAESADENIGSAPSARRPEPWFPD